MHNLRFGKIFSIFATLAAIFLISACQKIEIEVGLHAVNYSAEEFSYDVVDPDNPNKILGGEYIAPFSAGGTVCCAKLPRKWSEGTKVEIRTTYWKMSGLGANPLEFRQTYIAAVPKYVGDKPGQLWIVRTKSGEVHVVSSDFQPDHPGWPGEIKGWPQPSLQYKREKWMTLKNHQEIFVRNSTDLLKGFKQHPEVEARNAWDFAKKNDPASIEGFSGPNDPKYLASLRARYESALQESQEQLKKIMEAQP